MSQIDGLAELHQFLREFPDRVQTRVCRLATKKAGVLIVGSVKRLMPRQKKPGRSLDKDGKAVVRNWHTQDKVTSKAWNRKTTSLAIIGVQSGFGQLTHLIESGSQQRFTRHKTQYGAATQGTITRSKKVQTASGGWRTVRVQEVKRTKKSLGSSYVGSGTPKNRGRMPAFLPLAKAMAQTGAQAQTVIEQEVRAGLERELARNASRP
jgi:hypothetical protein